MPACILIQGSSCTQRLWIVGVLERPDFQCGVRLVASHRVPAQCHTIAAISTSNFALVEASPYVPRWDQLPTCFSLPPPLVSFPLLSTFYYPFLRYLFILQTSSSRELAWFAPSVCLPVVFACRLFRSPPPCSSSSRCSPSWLSRSLAPSPRFVMAPSSRRMMLHLCHLSIDAQVLAAIELSTGSM